MGPPRTKTQLAFAPQLSQNFAFGPCRKPHASQRRSGPIATPQALQNRADGV
jgi:hypothetical protein